jgi:hypothetical protein
LASTIYLTYTLFWAIAKYYTYPTLTVVGVDFHKELQFPAVTICNLSPYNISRLQPDPKRNTYEMEYTVLNDYGRPVNWSDPLYERYGYDVPVTPEYKLNVSMHSDDFILNGLCGFDGVTFNDTKTEFTRRMTETGICYTYNANNSVSTRLSGTAANLVMALNIDQSNYFWSESLAAGIKVILLVHLYNVATLYQEL